MRIGRAIIIPAILALGVAGSTVAGSAIAVAAGHLHPQGSSVHVQSKIAYGDPNFYYHS
jgi:hypothetical protein